MCSLFKVFFRQCFCEDPHFFILVASYFIRLDIVTHNTLFSNECIDGVACDDYIRVTKAVELIHTRPFPLGWTTRLLQRMGREA